MAAKKQAGREGARGRRRIPPGRGRRPPNQGKKCDALPAPVQRVQIWVNIGIREMLTTKVRPLDVGSRPSIIPSAGYSTKPSVWQCMCRTNKYIRHRNVLIKFVAYLAYPQVYCGSTDTAKSGERSEDRISRSR